MVNPSENTVTKQGLWAAITAYVIWGVFPVYFMSLRQISPMEILSHRVVWSVVFGLLILIFRKQIKEVIAAFRKPKTLSLLALASLAMASNWGVYIWAVHQGQIFQGSLGYYINPLIYVLVGVLFFNEKLSRNQGFAVFLAAIGVMILTFYGGQFPAIALFLGISFTIYGVIRKQVDIGAMPGLFIETLILLIPGLLYMGWLSQNSSFGFMDNPAPVKTLLVLAGPITVLPLVAFAFAARRLPLSMIGFLQFIGPTLQFACGLYYGEPFTRAHALCFGFIWLAVLIFSWEAWKNRGSNAKA